MRTETTRQMRWIARGMALLGGVPTVGLWLLATPVQAQQQKRINELNKPKIVSELKPGTTDKLTPAQWKIVEAKRAEEQAKKEANKPDVRPLSSKEMQKWHGSGPYRSKYYAGTLPWHRSLRDANLCNGNLFKSFTDIQVSPAKGAGLALQRTYNSQDSRPGPFGVGWTHAYDIRMEEENPTTNDTDPTLNYSDCSDFFGAKHKYHRDADGLYTPPAYLFDETESGYDAFLVNGPITVQTDTQTGMDGTIKHFAAIGNARFCDYMQDRYGNRTTLAYAAVVDNGATASLLSTVTDPSNRTLTFIWHNLGTSTLPIWRIVQVDSPQYSVVYAYNVDANLSSVTLDASVPAPGVGSVVAGPAPHVARTTTFGYTTYSDGGGSESGLLASIADPLGNTVSYTYVLSTLTNTLWVRSVTEPGGVIPGTNTTRTLTWNINPSGSGGFLTYFTTSPDASGNYLLMHMNLDTQLRKIAYWSADGSDDTVFTTNYSTDGSNNVTEATQELFGGDLGALVDSNMTFGPHGNQLTQTYNGFTGTNSTAYYNGSQYFQKQSVTDMNGHPTTMSVGAKTDPSPGNKGSVLWVKDAKYGDGTLNNTGTRFSYTYNAQGQKTSETNQGVNNSGVGIITNNTYGDAWGNLTQVVQDPTGLNRITSMNYDIAGHILSSTDPLGLTSTFHYNNLGQPTDANFPAKTNGTPAETITYSYDGNGRVHSVTDNRGQTITAYENGCDRVHSVTDPVTGETDYTYGLDGNRLSMTLPGGGTWTYGYAPSNSMPLETLDKDDPNSLCPRLLNVKDENGRIVEFLYPGSVVTVVQTLRSTLQSVRTNETFDVSLNLLSYQQSDYTYEGVGYVHGWLKSLSNTWHYKDIHGVWQSSLLFQNDYTYDNTGQRLSNKITSSDSSFRTEQYVYDELNRLKTVDYGDGQTQSYSFDAMGNRLSKTDVGGGINGTENYTVNNVNMLLTRGTANYTNDADDSTAWEQDALSNRSTWSYAGAVATKTDPNGYTQAFSYTSGRLSQVQDNSGNTIVPTYDTSNNKTQVQDQRGKLWNFTYDTRGNALTAKDPYTDTTTYTYNSHNKLLTAKLATGEETDYTYDIRDRLTQVDQKDTLGTIRATETYTVTLAGITTDYYDANSHRYQYGHNTNGELTSQTTPLGKVTTWGVNGIGVRNSRQDALLRTTTYTLDGWLRVTKEHYPTGTDTTFTLDANSNLTGWTDSTGTYTRAYDDDNRLLNEKKGTATIVSHTYDAAGQKGLLSTTTDANSRVLTYSYDGLNRLSSVAETAGTTSYGYDASSHETSITNANGTPVTKPYDDAGNLTSVTNKNSTGTVLSSFSYVYDTDNRRHTVTEASGDVVTYGYDWGSRLTTESRTGTNAYSLSYIVDGVGNRTSQTKGTATTAFTLDSDDQLNSTSSSTGGFVNSYAYNANGEQTGRTLSGTAYTVAFDYDGRQTSITQGANVTSYTYDGLDRRLSRTSGGTTTSFLYDGNEILLEKQGSTTTATYTYGNALVRKDGETPLLLGSNHHNKVKLRRNIARRHQKVDQSLRLTRRHQSLEHQPNRSLSRTHFLLLGTLLLPKPLNSTVVLALPPAFELKPGSEATASLTMNGKDLWDELPYPKQLAYRHWTREQWYDYVHDTCDHLVKPPINPTK